ncbi:hypothetical protein [Rhizobium alvei]|uniref:TPM domain-containing protein n=1 Tax=Rhizobium alvei TaxID=1132659 RepID=A0ABT8YS93_9HYPH|nr:hypothetical protein [Rhizobium alvei]MDO6966482.1 hypothetical protein [Rhizobium alvei]
MPTPVTKRAPQYPDTASSATDTAFLTVMLDVTANLLCTAIILLVLSLVIDRRSAEPVREDVSVVTAPILAPSGLVDAFRARTGTMAESVTIDVDETGVTVKRAHSPPATSVRLSHRDVTVGKLARLLAESGKATVLLFIFDQSGYAAVRTAIDKAGLPSREIDVPLALRSADDAESWSRGFQSLFGRDLDRQTFQQRLQQILVGQGDVGDVTTANGLRSSPSGIQAALDRLLQTVGFWWRLMLVGAALVFMIRFRRRSLGFRQKPIE